MTENAESQQLHALVAMVLWGGCITGALGLVVAVLAFFGGNLVAAAIATTGAGVVFGLLANAIVR